MSKVVDKEEQQAHVKSKTKRQESNPDNTVAGASSCPTKKTNYRLAA
jgi:hypothetical protein